MESSKKWLSYLRLFGKRFGEDHCLQWAASLSYTTILSLVPLIAVSFSLLSRSRLATDRVRSLLLEHLLPNSPMVERIPEYISQLSRNALALGVASVLFLAFSTSSLFGTVESVISSIWGSERRRRFLSRFSAYWTTVTLTPVLLAVSVAMTAKLSSLPLVGSVLKMPFADRIFYILLPLGLSVGGLLFLYLMVPRQQIRVRDAFWGALVAGALFEGAKAGFGFYVSHFASFTKIYGTLGTIPVFMVWVYLVWVIILAGAEVSFLCSGNLSVPEEQDKETGNGYRHYYGVRLLIEIGLSFQGGRGPARLDNLAATLRISTRLARSLVEKLKDRGLVAEVDDEGSYLPSRPLEGIYLQEVVDSVGEDVLAVPARSDGREITEIEVLFSRGRRAMTEALTGITVGELLRRGYL